jgi:hypothetical protein
LALGELLEASVFFEDALFSDLLHDSEPKMRVEAAKFLEDVEPFAMADRLRSCAQTSQTVPSDSTASAVDPARRSRCLRALPLLAEIYDGDDGLSRSLIAAIAALSVEDNRESDRDALCHALHEFAARNGRDAAEFLDPKEASRDSSAFCSTSDLAGLGHRERWSIHLHRFARAEGVKDSNSNAAEAVTRSFRHSGENADLTDSMSPEIALAEEVERAVSGDAAAIEAIEQRYATASGDDRERAYVALSIVGFERAAVHAVALLREPPASVLSYRAAQFIEDGDQTKLASELMDCLTQTDDTEIVRARCAIGLALTASDYAPSTATLEALTAAARMPAMRRPSCQALAEFAKRAAAPLPDVCATVAPELRNEPQLRWQQHLNALLELLTDQRRANGPYPNEPQNLHERELQRLEGARREVDRILASGT